MSVQIQDLDLKSSVAAKMDPASTKISLIIVVHLVPLPSGFRKEIEFAQPLPYFKFMISCNFRLPFIIASYKLYLIYNLLSKINQKFMQK